MPLDPDALRCSAPWPPTQLGPLPRWPGLLPRLCGLCETGVMSPFLTDIEKDRLLAYKESSLSKKECARRLSHGVHCVRRWWRRYDESGEGEWPGGKAPDVLDAPALKKTRPL